MTPGRSTNRSVYKFYPDVSTESPSCHLQIERLLAPADRHAFSLTIYRYNILYVHDYYVKLNVFVSFDVTYCHPTNQSVIAINNQYKISAGIQYTTIDRNMYMASTFSIPHTLLQHACPPPPPYTQADRSNPFFFNLPGPQPEVTDVKLSRIAMAVPMHACTFSRSIS